MQQSATDRGCVARPVVVCRDDFCLFLCTNFVPLGHLVILICYGMIITCLRAIHVDIIELKLGMCTCICDCEPGMLNLETCMFYYRLVR